MWAAVRKKFRTLKAGDLTWRFLHNKVRTGHELSWIDPELQVYPIYKKGLTVKHVWLECSVSSAVWTEIKILLLRLDSSDKGARLILPQNVNEIIAFMTFSLHKGPENRR
jgi:hypothetical protein